MQQVKEPVKERSVDLYQKSELVYLLTAALTGVLITAAYLFLYNTSINKNIKNCMWNITPLNI